MLSNEARTALRHIRAEVDEHWMQGSYDWAGNHCIVGFVSDYLGEPTEKIHSSPEAKEILTALQQALPGGIYSHVGPTSALITWNDATGRTRKDIKGLIDRALAS